MSLSSALLKKSGPPPALPPRPGAAGPGPGGVGGGVGSLGLSPTSISGGFGSNGSSGTGGFGSNSGAGGGGSSGSSSRAGGGGGVGTAYPPLPPRPGGMIKGRAKAAPDLAHCFELHSGKLLGDKRNREGRLYFKVRGMRRCAGLRYALLGWGWEGGSVGVVSRNFSRLSEVGRSFWPFSLLTAVVWFGADVLIVA